MKKTIGFTLIELLIVIAIIGLLGAMIMMGVNSTQIKAKRADSQTLISALDQALTLYFNETQIGYPPDDEARGGAATSGYIYPYRNDALIAYLDERNTTANPYSKPGTRTQCFSFTNKHISKTNAYVCVDTFNQPIWYHNFSDDDTNTTKPGTQPPTNRDLNATNPLHPGFNRYLYNKYQLYSEANYPGAPYGGKAANEKNFKWITNYQQ